MKVKNVVGTSGRTCNCENWLAHWEKYCGKKANYCGERSCMTTKDLVGAHVKRADISDSNTYILPLCKSHNQSTEEMEIYSNYELVNESRCK